MDERAMEKLKELRRKRKAKLEKMLKEDKLKDEMRRCRKARQAR